MHTELQHECSHAHTHIHICIWNNKYLGQRLLENIYNINILLFTKLPVFSFWKFMNSRFSIFSSVQLLSHVRLFVTPRTSASQVSLSITTLGVYSNSCPLSQWCRPTISSSVIPFASCLQSFPASGSFLVSQFFASGGQSIDVSALASVLPMNIQKLFPLGWTSWISLQSKGLARVFSNTTVQKHQFFGAQLPLSSKSHIHIWLLEKS